MEKCLGGRMLRPVDIEILGTSGGSKIVPVLVNGVPGGDAFAVGRGGAQKCTTSFSKTAVRGRTRRSPESSSVTSLSGRFLDWSRANRPDMSMLEGDTLTEDGAVVLNFLLEAEEEGRT